ncbi:hypothetical protein [Microbulbifer sp. SSSA005]|uniref:hypothetical protein n=1 Tax=unclassified Microbulbifer TaxID=2619833 RepID=UPI00403AE002
MSNKFISSWFISSLAHDNVVKGMIRKKVEKQYNQRIVDIDEFSNTLRKMYEDFDADGYDVINVVPIQQGQSEQSIGHTKEVFSESTYLGDVGFSITRGAVVIGKKRD